MGRTKSFSIDLLTLFPSFFKGPLDESLIKKAQERGLLKIKIHNLRDFTKDRHKTADDKPFGGGPGMVMKPEPIFECVEKIQKRKSPKSLVILLDPAGERLTQPLARKLAKKSGLILIAGHYEGVDYRVREHLADKALSVGDFVTMGGEAPALCVIEAVVRLLPNVIGNRESLDQESFEMGGLEYPQYTRPREYRGFKVPDVLMSGNHREVFRWRMAMARQLTEQKRPDLGIKVQKVGIDSKNKIK